jgi:putative transposase
MIDRDHVLTLTRQAALLGISRGAVYYLPRPESKADLALMRRIDELHLEHPFMGARMLRRQLRQEGVKVGRRHVSTLMKKMGIEVLAPQPGTSQRAPGHKIYPYLLRNVSITRSNQVWGLDTTYSMPSQRGPPGWGQVA